MPTWWAWDTAGFPRSPPSPPRALCPNAPSRQPWEPERCGETGLEDTQAGPPQDRGLGGVRGDSGCPGVPAGRRGHRSLAHFVFLPLQLLRVLKLVGLQLVQGFPELLGLVPGEGAAEREVGRSAPGGWGRAPPHPEGRPHVSFSSLRWSMLRGFRRSARTFFFISRAVCFLPLFWSA